MQREECPKTEPVLNCATGKDSDSLRQLPHDPLECQHSTVAREMAASGPIVPAHKVGDSRDGDECARDFPQGYALIFEEQPPENGRE